MSDPFYKAPKSLLADRSLSPAAKLVRIVQGHYLSFEGREATARELAAATGLTKRCVNKILAAHRRAEAVPRWEQSSRAGGNRVPAQVGTEFPQVGTPFPPSHSSLDIKTKERETDGPPPPAARKEKKTAAAAAPFPLGRHLYGRTVGLIRERTSEEEWEALGTETVRRHGREALTAFLAYHEHLVFWPRELPERVRAWWDEERRRRWDERLRQIREGNLKTAEPVFGPKDDRAPPSAERRYRVRWAGDGVLAIERQTLVRRWWEWDGKAYRREYRYERAEEAEGAWRLLPDGTLLPGVEW